MKLFRGQTPSGNTRRFPAWCLTPLLVFALAESGACGADDAKARVEQVEGLPIVHLGGSPYEIGQQHGRLLREEVRASVAQVLGYFRSYLKIPLVRAQMINWWLDSAWHSSKSFVSANDREELTGLAAGAGVPLRELYRLHAIPDRTYSCSNFAAWGRATAGGRLIHGRNLDWNMKAGIQRYAAVFVVRPLKGHAYVNVAWAGFTGVLTGVNEAQLSIGQIGAETVDVTFRGEPMVFVMKRVMKEASSLDQAEALITQARRTVGVNYVIADAKVPDAIVLETTAHHARRFGADDPKERHVPYARLMADAVFRADTAIDPTIRDRQLASDGDPDRAGLEPPGGSAYSVRYLGSVTAVQQRYGRLTPQTAQEITRAVAPDSNVQSVIIAWPDLWVANAQGTTPAAQTTYRHLDLDALLKK